MNRKDITKFLSELLEADRFSGLAKHWAKEVSFEYGKSKGNPKRVDYMQFVPENQISVSGIEKGYFICYEIKSCIADVYSNNGLNFFGEKNYIVTTMECYKKLLADMNSGKFWDYLRDNYPESSMYVGVMVAMPRLNEVTDEFENPTPLDKSIDLSDWETKIIYPCNIGSRKRSMTELLFCMLRSGR
jgi:hypothetical protein